MIDWSSKIEAFLGPAETAVLPPEIQLPVLPQAAIEFSQKSKEEGATAKDLGSIVEKDSGLTCELLKQINSSACGVRTQVTSASHAIALLGLRTTKLLVLSAATSNVMRSRDSKVLNIQSFWTTNLERALFAREVAVRINADPELAFSAGMLQDFLLPTLSNERPDEYVGFLTELSQTNERLDQLEQRQFGWNHVTASGQVLRAWSFPDDLLACILFHHHGLRLLADPELGKSAAAAVAVSALMPDPIRQTPTGLAQLQKLDEAWPTFNLLEVAKQVDEKLTEFEAPRANHISLARRVEAAMATA
ncbi:HDOD domain-containing protein [Calycomorphotria hydatis]|uniref:HDOD domain protein n=1 Tax=Calycomorphotria hydatis TaxID=2528027 RepID=A0A517T346_9PLAN|nr:HDOD domain-containing protein [Calycomorphotria hydatis]QDT62804.1 HDOD domain protein [Calycomorphotria hydatis]